MLQAPLADCQCLDLRSLPQNCFVAAEVNVGGYDIVQALVVALVVVILDEGPDLAFKVAGEVVIFQQHTVLHSLVPTLYLALGLRVEWRPANMRHFVAFQPLCQIA